MCRGRCHNPLITQQSIFNDLKGSKCRNLKKGIKTSDDCAGNQATNNCQKDCYDSDIQHNKAYAIQQDMFLPCFLCEVYEKGLYRKMLSAHKIYETQTGLYTTLHPVAGISLIVCSGISDSILCFVNLVKFGQLQNLLGWHLDKILNIRPRSFYTLPVW